MKKAINISLWVLGVGLALFSLSFVNSQRLSLEISAPKINIEGGSYFIDQSDIINKLMNANLIHPELNYEEMDVAKMEELLGDIPEVEKVDVFVSLKGELEIKIIQKNPIVRIINNKGQSVYLDDKGYVMPMSQKYTARVPVFSGHINEMYRNQSKPASIQSDSTLIDDIYRMSIYMEKEPFWKSQIVQVYVNDKEEFELIPRVGRHRILFGTSKDLITKFEKLKLLYFQGFEDKEWNNFDTINLKFKDQVVCSKR